MDSMHERRSCGDRRTFAILYRKAGERRKNMANRRLDMGEKQQSGPSARSSDVDDQTSVRTSKTIKEIAQAFGVHPARLEMLEPADSADSKNPCLSCDKLQKINSELKFELAKSRRNLEIYRKQLGEFLLSLSTEKGVPLA